jgi:hypothetical protein
MALAPERVRYLHYHGVEAWLLDFHYYYLTQRGTELAPEAPGSPDGPAAI